ncbi:hypothetical protein P8452_59596 [Trifolium repens]|nr:hypothetical protein P8452_59596 [Trifolium repens]
MFEEMEREGIRPNGVTLDSVLTACTHAGFIQEGRLLFVSMIEDYCISPQIENYGCMVDLLSKVNRWSDVTKIRTEMKDFGVEKKCPGSSWIEINKEIHVFASDKYHPSYGQVHLLLVALDEQLRLAGYVHELGSILY